MDIKINIKRLAENLSELGKIGRNSHGGIDRALGSQSDRDARKWILDYWKEHLDTEIRIDGIANMWAYRSGTEGLPPIVFGSHHDAVPDGGMYDGALGVLVATEIMETLKENEVKTRHPFEIVSFTGEEPNPYNVSTLGSKVLSGRLKRPDLEKLTSFVDGSDLQSCMEKIGGDISKTDGMIIGKDDICAFLECHIEQGRRLVDKGLSTSAVSCITGIYRENLEFIGEANHAGTTQMPLRKDALAAAAEFITAFEKTIKDVGEDEVVGTIGQLNVSPNAVSIVPGKVTLTFEIRTCSSELSHSLAAKMDSVCERITAERGVEIIRLINLDQQEMPLDKDIRKYVLEAMAENGEGSEELVSMAGHDAANMQRVTRSGMIFTQSTTGKSHCPEEYTDIECIEKTANTMLSALLKMDMGFDK
ncbi:MAG: Zn-dependent hydrolase [Huintestinicola sp.]